MQFISVQIVRFVDGHQLGWVDCELVDADGCHHTFTDKVPLLTSKNLGADSEYPTPGSIPCEVLKRYRDEKGREVVTVSTIKPAEITSKQGLSQFTVPARLVTNVPH